MKKNNQSIAWLSFYGITITMAIVISGSIKPQPKQLTKIVKTEIDTMELILNLILEKEGASAKFIGDGGKSYGSYQIQENAIKDVNKRYKTKYRHKDAFNKKKSKEIAKLYLKLGREDYIRKRGIEPTINTYLRMWNGGVYNGYNSVKTLNY
jgi:hypothetical protein